MAAISTKELFDRYFKDDQKSRAAVDREAVYEYEKQHDGKQIIDMNADELRDLILFMLVNNDYTKSKSLSLNAIHHVTSKFRAIWNYYIDNYEVIRNPWYDEKLRGSNLIQYLADGIPKFSYEIVENIFKKIDEEYEGTNYNYGEYTKCIILLFYNGFATGEEIISMKAENIDFETREVHLPNKTIWLSEECFNRLKQVHETDVYTYLRGSCTAVSYHGSYFKVTVQNYEVENLQKKTPVEVSTMLTRKISMNIRQKYNINISYRDLYLLGFFDFIVRKVGKERARELVMSVRNTDDNNEILSYADEYGLASGRNASYVKSALKQFL